MEKPRLVYAEIKNFSQLPEYFIHDYHTHLLCKKGFMEFKFNGNRMRCSDGEFLFWFAESRISEVRFSRHFRAAVLLAEKKFLMDNIPDQSWSINSTLYSREHPVKSIEKPEQQRITQNFQTITQRYGETGHRFYEEILRMQMQIFVLEMWNIFAEVYERRAHSAQGGTLYERFMHLAGEHCLTQREVQFYAAELNITPKYLNLICKKASGTTASEWIERYARERLVLLLENKTLNISQIADEMAFSSRSFFTRYVKKLLGMTPTEYRDRMGN